MIFFGSALRKSATVLGYWFCSPHCGYSTAIFCNSIFIFLYTLLLLQHGLGEHWYYWERRGPMDGSFSHYRSSPYCCITHGLLVQYRSCRQYLRWCEATLISYAWICTISFVLGVVPSRAGHWHVVSHYLFLPFIQPTIGWEPSACSPSPSFATTFDARDSARRMDRQPVRIPRTYNCWRTTTSTRSGATFTARPCRHYYEYFISSANYSHYCYFKLAPALHSIYYYCASISQDIDTDLTPLHSYFLILHN